MKLIISSSELLKGVMAVSKAIPAKSPLPILENFLFDLKGNVLELTASDTELTLRTRIEVESTSEEGRIAVPAKHIMDLLKELWATGDTQKVTDGVLGATSIWGEDLHSVKGLAELVKKDLDLIQEKGMLEAVKTIL